MRCIDCPCGHRLEGADDDELFRLARQHVEEHHPEMQRSDEQLRARVAADAYDACGSDLRSLRILSEEHPLMQVLLAKR